MVEEEEEAERCFCVLCRDGRKKKWGREEGVCSEWWMGVGCVCTCYPHRRLSLLPSWNQKTNKHALQTPLSFLNDPLTHPTALYNPQIDESALQELDMRNLAMMSQNRQVRTRGVVVAVDRSVCDGRGKGGGGRLVGRCRLSFRGGGGDPLVANAVGGWTVVGDPVPFLPPNTPRIRPGASWRSSRAGPGPTTGRTAAPRALAAVVVGGAGVARRRRSGEADGGVVGVRFGA